MIKQLAQAKRRTKRDRERSIDWKLINAQTNINTPLNGHLSKSGNTTE
jgi:hypothetical protein